MSDYFTRGGRPAPSSRDGAKTPTSYVCPTVKTPSALDGRSAKPGHSVKPSVRHTETYMSPSQSQTLPNRGTASRSSHHQHSAPRTGATGSNSLSRTFSLASADLLNSNGPDSYQTETKSQLQNEGGARRERPCSARLTGGSGNLSVDPWRFSVAPSKDDDPQPLSSSSLQQDRVYGSRTGTIRPTTPHHHRGEVALVTPVRAVSSVRLEEVDEGMEPRQAEIKKSDNAGLTSYVEERPMSTPASPDPNDQQTVWYEYGCV